MERGIATARMSMSASASAWWHGEGERGEGDEGRDVKVQPRTK
jgi:hypothetical protein